MTRDVTRFLVTHLVTSHSSSWLPRSSDNRLSSSLLSTSALTIVQSTCVVDVSYVTNAALKGVRAMGWGSGKRQRSPALKSEDDEEEDGPREEEGGGGGKETEDEEKGTAI